MTVKSSRVKRGACKDNRHIRRVALVPPYSALPGLPTA